MRVSDPWFVHLRNVHSVNSWENEFRAGLCRTRSIIPCAVSTWFLRKYDISSVYVISPSLFSSIFRIISLNCASDMWMLKRPSSCLSSS